ncbi:ubiquitin carboxyl-terminal hydrolase 12 [Fusarium heterosporum]|uniref:ubiquitinyl hydrolase 1 n=1 Tax=Fusarium heterosporum TaxID=42747 RepID=A0A8H5TWF5_FUSHE|nr:ubiquitin carboxyl-terminal hydrolase 12 [Fusarium heterosporum]
MYLSLPKIKAEHNFAFDQLLSLLEPKSIISPSQFTLLKDSDKDQDSDSNKRADNLSSAFSPPPLHRPPSCPRQLAFKTSSSKKRKLLRNEAPLDSIESSSPSPDSVLPSCEIDDDPAFSFSASVASRPDTPSYLRSDSQPASSLPPRLQHQPSSLASADYASSAVSSPCASAYADLSIDSDRGGDETGTARTLARSQSPLRLSHPHTHRVIMNGDADLPHRSSSPLKRRASSMDPENEADKTRDVDMGSSQVNNSTTVEDPSASTLPRAMSIDVPESTVASISVDNASPSQSIPSLQEQIKIIETLLKAYEEAQLKEGDKAYLVSNTWVQKALALRGGSKDDKDGDSSSDPLGPVDNSDIIEEVIKEPSGKEFVRLKQGTNQNEFALFPEDAWKMVVDWYGVKDGQEPIIRTAINTAETGEDPNIVFEFHPPVFTVHRLWSTISPLPIEQSLKAENPPPYRFARSRKYHAQTFVKDIKTATGVPVDHKIRLFVVPQVQQVTAPSDPSRALTPPDSPGRDEGGDDPANTWSKLLLDNASFSRVREQRIKCSLEDKTVDKNFNGSSNLTMYDLVTDQTLVIDESIEAKVWVSNYTGKTPPNGLAIPTRSGLASSNASGRSSPAPGGTLTRGRMGRKPGRGLGVVGLQNLGNTCYMNSALQCVRSVEELTQYFLTGEYADEVNKTNPLGYNGKVAMTYGHLLKDIYQDTRGSVTPRDFKNTIGRCRSTFSGYGQQDSQEFLGFLLDALQEDLSRVKKKPYIEKPDSTDDMINNPEAIKAMADKVWDITRLRDDSVIADLFTGLYKSTLKCPECGKISITFDPFNNLTLPIPVEDVWMAKIKFLPLSDVPVILEVELPKHSAIEQLKQFISVRTGVPTERLIGGEEYKDRFFKLYDNDLDVSEEIAKNDLATFHELEIVPTNWPHKTKKLRSMLDVDSPPETQTWDDPRYERMVVPVFHRIPSSYGRGRDGVAPPSFVCFTKEEASDIDLIRRKILEKVATFSTWTKLRDGPEDSSENVDGEVVASASDADSSGDIKVVAKSIESEDDIVDVHMKDDEALPNQPQILKRFNTARPKFVNPDSFLDPELQNLFELCYFTDKSYSGHVPTGWSSVDHHHLLPKLSDRIPQPTTPDDEDVASRDDESSTPSNEDASSNDESTKAETITTRMVDESSEEDPQEAPRKFNARPSKVGPGGRRKVKAQKYGKKGNKRRERNAQNKKLKAPSVRPQPQPPAVADGGPLIRLGEGIVVDWNEDAFDKVFGGSSTTSSDQQGSPTFTSLATLNDTALKIVQRKRQHRRTRGITLDECLDEFERAEVLSEQDMWYCPRCKEHRRASKKFDLWKSPDILVAHLKRFSSSGYRRDKLDVMVDFPIEGLDLTSRVIQKEDGKVEIYDLIAVDDHYGGLGGGHYTAYAKNFCDGRWYNYNDSSASPVSDPSSCITSAAYLLFYRRRSNTPLGGSRFRAISEKYKNSADNSEEEDFEAGEGQRLGEGSSLTGLSSAGTGAAATHRLTGRGSDRVTVTSLAGPDDDDDDLPSYGATQRIEDLHDSIEDEGVDVKGGYQPLDGGKSLSLMQDWSFEGLGDSGAENSTGADIASDDVQLDSSADERGFDDPDTIMTGHEPIDDEPKTAVLSALTPADIRQGARSPKKVFDVPATAGSERDSNEVTEIHLETEREPKAE